MHSKKVKERFVNPKGMGYVPDNDGEGEVGNKICGDSIKITFKLDDNTNTIVNAKYQTYGCVYSIACADQLVEMLIGKTVDEANQITSKMIINELESVPVEKQHCATMALNAWGAAFRNSQERKGLKVDGKTSSSNFVEIKPGEDLFKDFKISKEKQLEHRIAELFDEWFIPELQRKSIIVSLENVDTFLNTIEIRVKGSASFATNFINSTLKKYFTENLKILILN